MTSLPRRLSAPLVLVTLLTLGVTGCGSESGERAGGPTTAPAPSTPTETPTDTPTHTPADTSPDTPANPSGTSTDLPTDLPTTPSDTAQKVRVEARVSAVGEDCVDVVTDDGVDWALVGEVDLTLEPGARVRVVGLARPVPDSGGLPFTCTGTPLEVLDLDVTG